MMSQTFHFEVKAPHADKGSPGHCSSGPMKDIPTKNWLIRDGGKQTFQPQPLSSLYKRAKHEQKLEQSEVSGGRVVRSRAVRHSAAEKLRV